MGELKRPKECGSHSCIIAPPKGMGVNGPCRCDIHTLRSMVLYQKRLIMDANNYLLGGGFAASVQRAAKLYRRKVKEYEEDFEVYYPEIE